LASPKPEGVPSEAEGAHPVVAQRSAARRERRRRGSRLKRFVWQKNVPREREFRRLRVGDLQGSG
jgi:hypothetical protein